MPGLRAREIDGRARLHNRLRRMKLSDRERCEHAEDTARKHVYLCKLRKLTVHKGVCKNCVIHSDGVIPAGSGCGACCVRRERKRFGIE